MFIELKCFGSGDCSNQGVCDVSTGTCTCNPGFQGDTCNCKSGDCFLMTVNTGYCSELNCMERGVITSPGFPGNYDNNLDLTRLIHVQIGQTIEIRFLSFAVEEQEQSNPTTIDWWFKSNRIETYW